jgi:hypothetical protein
MSDAQEVRGPIDFRFSSLASATMCLWILSPLRQSSVKFSARGADAWLMSQTRIFCPVRYPRVVFDLPIGHNAGLRLTGGKRAMQRKA